MDTFYPGAFPCWVFGKAAPYDERFIRKQDCELKHRIRQVGGLDLRLFRRPALWLWTAAIAAYVFLGIAFSASRVRREPDGRRYLPLMPVVFATLHVAWGLGFWWAWLALLLGRDPLAAPDAAETLLP